MNKSLCVLNVFLLCLAYRAASQTGVRTPVVSVTASGEVRKTPDQVTVSVGVEIHDEVLNNAKDETDSRSSDIIAYLKDNGVLAKDIQTSSVNVRPFYNDTYYSDGKADPLYYIAQKDTTFVLKNISIFEDILSGLYDAGVNSVNGITFGLQELEEPRAQARKLALLKADAIATNFTKQLNVSKGGVYSITDNTGSQPYFADISFAEATGDAVSGPSIAGGQVIVSASVNLKFYLRNNTGESIFGDQNEVSDNNDDDDNDEDDKNDEDDDNNEDDDNDDANN